MRLIITDYQDREGTQETSPYAEKLPVILSTEMVCGVEVKWGVGDYIYSKVNDSTW